MPTLLYAEDDLEHRMMMETLVIGTEIKLILAVNGEDALTKIQATSPDLILLDLFMPVMDGFTVMQEIKNDPDIGDIPILVLSAWPTGDNRQRAKDAGAIDFIVKPYDPEALINILIGHLHKPQIKKVRIATEPLEMA